MKKYNIEFKAGNIPNFFKLFPCIGFAYTQYSSYFFSIEFSWLNYGFGWRFTKKDAE